MAMYLFLTEYILWNVNIIFCMFISIIHSFHILSWLLDECGWENGLYNFYRTTVDWGMIGRASQWNILKRKESSGRRHITLLTIICVGGMWTARKRVECGRPVNVMTPYNKQRLRQAVNNKTGLSKRNLAGRFNCS